MLDNYVQYKKESNHSKTNIGVENIRNVETNIM